jgi:hypothetical protein
VSVRMGVTRQTRPAVATKRLGVPEDANGDMSSSRTELGDRA